MNWTDKRVAVTGADGFIGSHLVESLVAAGAEVTAFCLYNSNGSRGWLDTVDEGVQSEFRASLGDIRDARFVRESLGGHDVVFHLAALIAIPYSYQAPQSFVDTNITGTVNILETARGGDVGRIVQTSTSEVYGTPDTLPITEKHPLNGQSPYSATKIAADKMCEAYYRSFQVPVVTLRPFNTYGPRQSARAVIPTILSQMLSGFAEIRLGSLAPRRDLTFVTDVVDGFLRAGSVRDVEGMTIQLGTGRTESIGDIFEMARRVTGSTAEPITDEQRLRPDRSEVQVLQSDPSVAHDVLGWKAEVSLESGLERTASWIAGNLDGFRPEEYQR